MSVKKLLAVALLYFALVAAFLVLTGCARFSDGYQFGDITLSLGDAVHAYCNEVPDIPKDVALKAIRAYLPLYPKDGICGE